MRIVNIIDSFEKVNFGIWNAAIATAPVLKEKFYANSELWYPVTEYDIKPEIDCVSLDLNKDTFKSMIKSRGLSSNNDIIVSHGCWQYPTRWGCELKKLGFKWIYVPHGMLEPWSMEQKKWKKYLYFRLIENRFAGKADCVRAVGKPEYKNLKNYFQNVVLIPNGTNNIPYPVKDWNSGIKQFLFMGRLHFKKGIIPLVQAWKKSSLYKSGKHKLVIAGPDDGELNKLKKELLSVPESDICYLGAIYGEKKDKILKESHFYVMPSYSEGFPTSVIESMQYGLIPVISDGCNFPEAFENNLAVKIAPNENEILMALQTANNLGTQEAKEWSFRVWKFVAINYSLEKIADQQYELYSKLITDAI